MFRGVPIGLHRVLIRLEIPRVECQECWRVRQVKVAFAIERRSYCHGFARMVIALSRCMTLEDIAHYLNVSWDLVKGIVKDYLTRRFRRIRLRDLKRIAIDEISVGRGHKYLTVVLDLESRAVVFIGKGRGASALTPFWRQLRSSHAKIEAVATDMSPAYIEAVLTNLRKAVLVFDRFHIVKLFNEKLSDLRRDLYREVKDQMQKDVLKGTRWLLLKRPTNLNPARDEQRKLQEALKLNEPLATAYYMKEELLELLWSHASKQSAAVFLQDWVNRALGSGIRALMQMGKTLAKCRAGILNWYDFPISTGPLEGTNNKIRAMQHQGYGYRDIVFLTLKIFALHEAKFALVG
jgi:transposase